MNLNELRIRSTVLNDKQISLMFKAALMGNLFSRVNRKRLETDPNYKAMYNAIVKKHYTLQNKFQYLEELQNATNKASINTIMKTVDWNLIQTNANYRALYNRVSQKANVKSVLNETTRVRIRRQQGGTCWFHAILNGLLLSPRPREALKMLTEGVTPLRINGDVCPSKKAGHEWFLRYIKYRLQGGLMNNAVRNKNAIRTSGLRGYFRQPGFARVSFPSVVNTGLKLGGASGDLIWFYKTFFPMNFTNRNGNTTPMFVMRRYGKWTGSGANPEVPHTLTRGGVRYELTHAWIAFWVKPWPEGHAVAGYKNKHGHFLVYDSGLNQRINCNWTKAAPVSEISREWAKHGYKTGDMNILAIYTRHS